MKISQTTQYIYCAYHKFVILQLRPMLIDDLNEDEHWETYSNIHFYRYLIMYLLNRQHYQFSRYSHWRITFVGI